MSVKSRWEALVNRLRLTSWLAEHEPMTSKARPLLKLPHGASGASICHGLDPSAADLADRRQHTVVSGSHEGFEDQSPSDR
jgi:hypothetical protein